MADALPYCLNLLKRRLRSEFELNQAMTRRGFEEEDRQAAVTTLKELQLVDDLRFARAWVHTRDLLAPRGEAVLRQELNLKGIPRDIIAGVLQERREEAADAEAEQPTEEELARRLMAGRQRLYSNLSPEVRKRRLTGFLQRRGFSYSTIRRILDA